MEELIKTLEEIKEHQMQTVQLARTTTVYKLADKAINQALSLGAVVGRSEQLKAFGKSLQYKGVRILTDEGVEQAVKDFERL